MTEEAATACLRDVTASPKQGAMHCFKKPDLYNMELGQQLLGRIIAKRLAHPALEPTASQLSLTSQSPFSPSPTDLAFVAKGFAESRRALLARLLPDGFVLEPTSHAAETSEVPGGGVEPSRTTDMRA